MNSIRDEWIALDTNQFIFALRQDPAYPFCEHLLFDHLPELQIYFPLQILLELQRNLAQAEMHNLFLALTRARNVVFDYAQA